MNFIFRNIFLLNNILATFLFKKSKDPVYNNSLLLIAHPDDESMFFSPFLFSNKPFILCLSDGNFYGKGNERRNELLKLCKNREINFKILDFIDNSQWNINEIVLNLIFECLENKIKTIVTFDSFGISGHKNHISCYKAAKVLEKMDKNKVLKFKYLKSTNSIKKYLLYIFKSTHSIPLYSFFGFKNMLFHRSQLMWFRYFYVLFSIHMRFSILN